MRLENIRELSVLALNNQAVHDILADSSIGRKKAAELIRETTGDLVSEKLVRTWRDNQKNDERAYSELAAMAPPRMPRPAGPAIAEFAVHIEDPKLYNEELNRINMELWGDPSPAPNHEYRLKADGTAKFGQAMKNVPTKRPMVKTSKTIVVMPDVQAPLHDQAMVDKFIQFLADYEPDELAQVGDFTDSTEISRWVRGKKPEYAGDLQQGFDISRYILEKIREVHQGRFRIVRSNHDDRLELYIQGCAPGLASLRALSIENLVGFDDFDVEFIRDEVVELTPEARDPWIMCHGDEGALNQVAGRTAFNLAKNKFGANVICGHTHRAGLTSESYGYNGKIRDTRYGLEVGHFMDLTKADYLKKKGVGANWQQAFGILHVHGSQVYPQLVSVDYNGNFSVEGKLY